MAGRFVAVMVRHADSGDHFRPIVVEDWEAMRVRSFVNEEAWDIHMQSAEIVAMEEDDPRISWPSARDPNDPFDFRRSQVEVDEFRARCIMDD